MRVGWKELLAVTGVGAVLGFAARRAPLVNRLPEIALGAGLYAVGYYVAAHRPREGWTGAGVKELQDTAHKQLSEAQRAMDEAVSQADLEKLGLK